MTATLRILDANANRAREALRVLEEAARFVLDDAALSERLKQMRHDLAGALALVWGLEASRDTPGDVGTQINTTREGERASVRAVVIAAGKRLSEALRALEEYGKVLAEARDDAGTPFAARIEALRYQGYDIEHKLSLALGSGQAKQWRLCVLISEALCAHHDWQAVAQACIDNGANCLQLREKDLPARALLQRTRQLVSMARPRGVSVIVNDRPDVAALAGADGVHLGQGDLSPADVRRLVGETLIVGVSTSKLDEAKQALRDGADYCGVGPMFATRTKAKDVIAGPEYLQQFVQWGRLPHLAIGGISLDNAEELVEAGAQGLAVSSAVCGAARPGEVVAQLRALFE
jgi:thiamine-phosphate pyrophosphorylase